MSNRPRPRVYFFRNGIELSHHPHHGRCLLHFGLPTGKVGNATCFDSVTVRTTVDQDVTEADFEGPVSVKVWCPEQRATWFGLASAATVAKANATA